MLGEDSFYGRWYGMEITGSSGGIRRDLQDRLIQTRFYCVQGKGRYFVGNSASGKFATFIDDDDNSWQYEYER